MSDDDDRILAEAQRKLEANRQEYQRELAAGTPTRLTLPRQAGSAAVSSKLPKRRIYAIAPPEEPSEAVIKKRILETIPERFLGITWDTLADLRNDDGELSLGVVEVEGRSYRGAAAVNQLWTRIRAAKKVVLLGETRAGKTVAGIAALEGEIRQGNERARWTHAPTLKEPDVMARALSSSFLLLDDLGYELNGAQANSGWLPQYRAPACDFLGRWYLRRDARLMVTTFLDYAKMAELYGAGVAARAYEGAEVIELRREAR